MIGLAFGYSKTVSCAPTVANKGGLPGQRKRVFDNLSKKERVPFAAHTLAIIHEVQDILVSSGGLPWESPR